MLKPKIVISDRELEGKQVIYCQLIWEGQPLDRPSTGGLYLRQNQRNVALAYQRAVEDGKIYSHPEVEEDIFGHTYVVCKGFVMAKYLPSDLRKLGYL